MNNYIKLLPNNLITKYKVWKTKDYEKNKTWFKKIALKGQSPSTMVISCCDSRIHVTSILGPNNGEFFIHRNIANLVPAYNPDGDYNGTSAALEYAVKILKVSNIIIFGHSQCGGIHSGYNLFNKNINIKKNIFINKWLSNLHSSFEKIIKENKNINRNEGIKKLEKESIKNSINNLIEFPFIANLLKKNKLSLHGLWHDIGSGQIEILEPDSLNFIKL